MATYSVGDLIRHKELQELVAVSPKATRVADVMSRNVRHVSPETTVEQALQLMVSHRYRHLLVQDGAKVLGLISIRDIMYSLIVPEMAMAPEGRHGHMRSRAEEAVRLLQSARGGEGQR
jgi:CBS domain-containing protein